MDTLIELDRVASNVKGNRNFRVARSCPLLMTFCEKIILSFVGKNVLSFSYLQL